MKSPRVTAFVNAISLYAPFESVKGGTVTRTEEVIILGSQMYPGFGLAQSVHAV